jgi:hypothetical protein
MDAREEATSERQSPRRWQVSVRGELYDRLRAEAKRRGITIQELTEIALGGDWRMLS